MHEKDYVVLHSVCCRRYDATNRERERERKKKEYSNNQRNLEVVVKRDTTKMVCSYFRIRMTEMYCMLINMNMHAFTQHVVLFALKYRHYVK